MSLDKPKTPGLVTIRYIVMSILNRMEDYTMKKYKRLVQIAIEGYGELSLWHLNTLEVVYLRMNEAKVVSLPADYVDFLKIGIPINGKLRVLTQHNQILLPRTFEDGTYVGNIVYGAAVGTDYIGEPAVFFSDHFRGGQYVGGLFGLPGGIDTAYFRIDRENRQIVFSGSVPRSEIVLEYLSTGVKTEEGSLIPREAVPALRTYVMWQMIEYDSRVPANDKERKKRQHEEEIEALRSFQSTFTKEVYQRMLFSTYRQTAKR